MLERKIYVGTAYRSDESEMNKINREIFNELDSKYKKLFLSSYEDSKRLNKILVKWITRKQMLQQTLSHATWQIL